MTIRVLHVGLGPIGAAVARQLAGRKTFRIVGAVDIDPNKVGEDVGDVAEIGRTLRVKVNSDLRKTIKATKPDIAVLCTSSSLKSVMPQLEELLKLRVPVVSTTEELAYLAGQPPPGEARRRAGAQGEGRGARHRREPGVRDGRAADRHDRGLRARRAHRGAPRAGRAHPPPAVPAEDRRRPHARAVREAGRRPAPCGTSASPNRSR